MRTKRTTQGQPGTENYDGQASWWSVSLQNYLKKHPFNLLQASEVNMTFYMTVKISTYQQLDRLRYTTP